jgi:hypothetical protein
MKLLEHLPGILGAVLLVAFVWSLAAPLLRALLVALL